MSTFVRVVAKPLIIDRDPVREPRISPIVLLGRESGYLASLTTEQAIQLIGDLSRAISEVNREIATKCGAP